MTSKFSIVVLGNFALVLTLLLGRIVKYLFLGALRDVEVEILYDNARYETSGRDEDGGGGGRRGGEREGEAWREGGLVWH